MNGPTILSWREKWAWLIKKSHISDVLEEHCYLKIWEKRKEENQYIVHVKKITKKEKKCLQFMGKSCIVSICQRWGKRPTMTQDAGKRANASWISKKKFKKSYWQELHPVIWYTSCHRWGWQRGTNLENWILIDRCAGQVTLVTRPSHFEKTKQKNKS